MKLDESKPPSARGQANLTLVSTTDPDAPCVSKGPPSGTARPRYKHHRMVADRCGVITAVATTAGDVAEPAQVNPLLAQHASNTQREATALVADRGYGTVETYCDLIVQGVRPHMTPMHAAGHKRDGFYTKDDWLAKHANNAKIGILRSYSKSDLSSVSLVPCFLLLSSPPLVTSPKDRVLRGTGLLTFRGRS